MGKYTKSVKLPVSPYSEETKAFHGTNNILT